MKKLLLPVLLSTVWISISEFVRNSFIVHSRWVEHFQKQGLTFPEEPVNGAVWGIWSLVFATVIYILYQKFTFWQTLLLSWVIGFLMMWLVIGNLGVLPYSTLLFAIPLSFVEVFVALIIMKSLKRKK
jgi:hypothetical protein